MKRKIILLITALVILVSCQVQNNKNTLNLKTMNYELSTLYVPTDSTQFYFPNSVFYEFDNFCNKWYSKYLFAMREPVLFSDSSQIEIYRFVWLRTFHNPIAIRIEKQQNIYFLTWKLCNAEGGFEPGQLTIAKQKQIDDITWEEFKTLFNQIDFWSMDTKVETMGNDGARWILEGKVADKYHVVDRWTWSPMCGTYYRCCNFLIGLTDLTFNEKDPKY